MSRFGFNKMLGAMNQLKRELPLQVGNIGQRFFVNAFTKQGWTDKTFVPWVPRKDHKNRLPLLIGKSGGTKSGSHAHLRASVNTSVRSASWPFVTFGVPQPYARIQNEGGVIHKKARTSTVNFRDVSTNILTGAISRKFASKNKGRKYLRATSSLDVNIGEHNIVIPKRQYMGYSYTLSMQIKNRINMDMKKVLRAR